MQDKWNALATYSATELNFSAYSANQLNFSAANIVIEPKTANDFPLPLLLALHHGISMVSRMFIPDMSDSSVRHFNL